VRRAAGLGGGAGAPRRRWIRGAVAALLAGVASLSAGCATKRDMTLLRQEVVAMQARQDSLLRLHQRLVLDTLAAQSDQLVRLRGDLGHQLLQMEQQLVQIQELTGQGQQRLAELRQQLDSRSQAITATAPEPGGAAPSPGTAATADQLYTIGMEHLRQQAPQTARRAFEQIVRDHTTHERAADAQYNIGETYVLEQNFDRALREFDRVAELFPNSPRVPMALYRAGVISEERGNTARAREYFQRVVAGYPGSDERRQAEERLRRLRRN
jgi:tol-pal system protein YbgF